MDSTDLNVDAKLKNNEKNLDADEGRNHQC